ncbi:hypothetical protein F0U60_46155 [Archangium minus]|uniref:Uncharacterized protein n=1 Tax=Archangium minus TaxID=83450 RepID=A0ABY9X5N3_9BACT|nr:hypothetical protein F0U60_46155 [Archangium minus]
MPMTRTNPEYAAVDRAVAKVRAFIEELPAGQLVVEAVTPEHLKTEAKRIGEGAFFVRMHKARSGRWNKPPPRRAPGKGSSFDYFLQRYGTLTWVVSHELGDVDGFYCGNVSGGGWGVLEIGPSFNEDAGLDALAEAPEFAEYGLEHALVFHGGWGHQGYIMDGRVTFGHGEHPIYPFSIDEPLQGLPVTRQLGKKKPRTSSFGAWLEQEVNRQVRALRPKLKAYAQEQAEIARERETSARAKAGGKPLSLKTLAARAGEAELAEFFRDKATSEVWAHIHGANRFLVYDGEQLVPDRRQDQGYEGLKKLAEKDRALTRGFKTASHRQVLLRRDGGLFVALEAVGRQVTVARGWNNGWIHEETRTFDSPEAAKQAAEAFEARYRSSFKPAPMGRGAKPLVREFYRIEKRGVSYFSVKLSGREVSTFINGKQWAETAASDTEARELLEAELSKLRDGRHMLKTLEW